MKNPFKIVTVLAACACLAFAQPENKDPKVIVIDVAHGGKDHGATFNEFTEKQIAERVAAKIKALNKDTDIKIHFTRDNDEFVTLEDRVKTINALNPDLVLSLHVNFAKTDEPYGMEFFISDAQDKNKESSIYAGMLADKFEGYDTEIKQAKFYLLKNIDAPAIVFEMGYLSNEIDRQYLTSERSQETIAATVLEFIQEIE